MVQTRRTKQHAVQVLHAEAEGKIASIKVEETSFVDTRQPRKRRKVTKEPEISSDEIDAKRSDDASLVEVALKVKKKAKTKLLHALHPESALPGLQSKAMKIFAQLMELYKDPPCPLDHENPFQLLCSVILSAQSTDKKVNEIVPPLYDLAPDAKAMAALEVPVIEELIRKIGLAPTKAKNISKMSKALVERHGGAVPDNFEDLEQLAGVGHKTASVVLAVAFAQPTFPVDTHIYRLGLRWGLTAGKNVEQAEADLKVCWPRKHWNALHLRLIYFGREHCPAQRHDPAACPICCWAAVAPYDQAGSSPSRAGAPRSRT